MSFLSNLILKIDVIPIKLPNLQFLKKYHTSNKDKFQMDQDLNIKHATIKVLKENMEGFHYRLG